MFANNETMEDTEIKIQLKPGQHPVQQEATPVSLHLQKEVGRDLKRLMKSGHLEKFTKIVLYLR